MACAGPRERACSSFGELTRRSGDYAIAGAFINAHKASGTAGTRDTGGKLANVRVAYFGVSTRPVLARGAMAALEGSDGGAAALAAAQACLEKDLGVIADLYNGPATKLHLSRVLLARLLDKLN